MTKVFQMLTFQITDIRQKVKRRGTRVQNQGEGRGKRKKRAQFEKKKHAPVMSAAQRGG